MIRLGAKVMDKISGLTGIAVGRSEWLFGCTQICVAPEKLHDGKRVEGDWLDEGRLQVLKGGHTPADFVVPTGGTGGPPRSVPSGNRS